LLRTEERGAGMQEREPFAAIRSEPQQQPIEERIRFEVSHGPVTHCRAQTRERRIRSLNAMHSHPRMGEPGLILDRVYNLDLIRHPHHCR
jgi:hypothetical protein